MLDSAIPSCLLDRTRGGFYNGSFTVSHFFRWVDRFAVTNDDELLVRPSGHPLGCAVFARQLLQERMG